MLSLLLLSCSTSISLSFAYPSLRFLQIAIRPRIIVYLLDKARPQIVGEWVFILSLWLAFFILFHWLINFLFLPFISQLTLAVEFVTEPEKKIRVFYYITMMSRTLMLCLCTLLAMPSTNLILWLSDYRLSTTTLTMVTVRNKLRSALSGETAIYIHHPELTNSSQNEWNLQFRHHE